MGFRHLSLLRMTEQFIRLSPIYDGCDPAWICGIISTPYVKKETTFDSIYHNLCDLISFTVFLIKGRECWILTISSTTVC